MLIWGIAVKLLYIWNDMKYITKCDKILLFSLMFLVTIGFSQWGDLSAIIQNSNLLLSTSYSGDFFKFYDIGLAEAIAHSNIGTAPNYNIIIYLTIAVWILPIKIFSFLLKIPFPINAGVYWTEILIFLMAILMGKIIQKIAKELGQNQDDSRTISYICLSSPIVLFGSLGFGQCDIIGLNILLIAILFYIKEKYTIFCFIASLAICFKGFSFLLFLPMIALIEKRILHIVKYVIFGISLPILTKIIFLGTDGYQSIQDIMSGIYNFKTKIWKAQIPGGINNWSPFLLLMILICVWAYSTKITEQNKNRLWVYTGCLAFSVFAIFLPWHPQWLILLVPFLTLTYLFIENRKLLLLLDCLTGFGYVLLTCLVFPNNVDDSMLKNGILTKFITWKNTDVNIGDYWKSTEFPTEIVATLFFAGIVGSLMIIYKSLYKNSDEVTSITVSGIDRGLVYLRMFIIVAYVIFSIIIHI